MRLKPSSSWSWPWATFAPRSLLRCERHVMSAPGLYTGCYASCRTGQESQGVRYPYGFCLRLTTYIFRLPLRFLLRQTVNRAQSPHEIHRVDAHHGSVREHLAQHAQGRTVVRIIERGHEHRCVPHVEVRVACGQALAGELERRRHGAIDHLDRRPVPEPHPREPLAVL